MVEAGQPGKPYRFDGKEAGLGVGIQVKLALLLFALLYLLIFMLSNMLIGFSVVAVSCAPV